MKPASMITIKNIQNELGCSIDRATEIMHFELPHINIAGPGSKRPAWRARRSDFEKWINSREAEPGRAALERFTKKFMM